MQDPSYENSSLIDQSTNQNDTKYARDYEKTSTLPLDQKPQETNDVFMHNINPIKQTTG